MAGPQFPKVDRTRNSPAHLAALEARRAARPLLRPGGSIQRAIAPRPAGAAIQQLYNGTATDVMLQGFHWTSIQSQNPNWYQIVQQNAATIRAAKFDLVWFPPPSKSAFDGAGYMPTLWNNLNNAYGAQADLTAAMKALRPIRALADVVVNHRCGALSDGADFADPPFADQTGAICRDDESGIGTGNYDTGTHFASARDLDHTATQVQTAIINYLATLKAAGFSSWRYDMAPGYGGGYVGQYNDASKPYLSVGEFWDTDRQNVINWIDSTGGRSMAYDFPTRSLLKLAIDQRQFWQLKDEGGKPNGAIGFWSTMCVTFVDDHDTAVDGMSADPFGDGDQVLQAYAYILTHPGIPCVFWTHFFDWGQAIQDKIKALIALRKSSGLNSASVVNIVAADDGKYAAIIDGKIAIKLGPAPWDPGPGWNVAVDGSDFAVWQI
jgi:alpha-amylase